MDMMRKAIEQSAGETLASGLVLNLTSFGTCVFFRRAASYGGFSVTA
jgi:hypothetical protein